MQFGTGCGAGFANIQSGLGDSGAWTTANGSCDEVISAANFGGGAGGRGFRHYRGEGTNNNGGSMQWQWSAESAISWCVRIRYSSGFHWLSDGNPHYTKDLYFNVLTPFVVFGHQGGAWGYNVYGATNYPGSIDWVGLMGGANGDGVFHEFAGVIDIPNSTLKLWVDDALTLNETAVNFNPITSIGWTAPSNQNHVDNDNDGIGVGDETGATDGYTDYDDFVVDTNVSNGGKLEC
jgi:hypothetical protein